PRSAGAWPRTNLPAGTWTISSGVPLGTRAPAPVHERSATARSAARRTSVPPVIREEAAAIVHDLPIALVLALPRSLHRGRGARFCGLALAVVDAGIELGHELLAGALVPVRLELVAARDARPAAFTGGAVVFVPHALLAAHAAARRAGLLARLVV